VAAQVPAAIAARAARYRAHRDGQEILLGRLLLRAALDRAGRDLGLGAVTLSAQGRPELPAGYGDVSIAHADGFVVCVWSGEGRIGIDVEPHRTLDPAEYEAVLSPGERGFIAAAPDQSHALLRAWTLKEAIAKAAGPGMSAATLPDLAGPRPVAYDGRHWHLRHLDHAGFALALAFDRPQPGAIPFIGMQLGQDGQMQPDGPPGNWP
jgi:hypothetical protein